jgi:hypothetical protein
MHALSFRVALVGLLNLVSGCAPAPPDANAPVVDGDGDGATAGDDCDDANPASYPGAVEVCDGFDNDCDGSLPDDEAADWDGDGLLGCDDCNDLDDDLALVSTYYRDADSDGYGDPSLETYACDRPGGYVPNADDCDDADPFAYPLQTWCADSDGDGYGDPAACVQQCERPGAAWVNDATDCDDADPTELPDQTWYLDGDGDGYGGDAGAVRSCERPGDGYVSVGGDCADSVDAVFPNQDWAPDADADGFGDAALAEVSCGVPEGAAGTWVQEITDCDDTRAWVYPGAEERCDLVDSDCDGALRADELDDDADGYGVCNGDPDDADPTVFPLITTWVGVATNVAEADLLGWEECFVDTYGSSATSLADLQAACSKNNVMLACRRTGSGVLTAAAHAPRFDVFYDLGPGKSLFRDANGVSFYYGTSSSMGFAEAGTGVSRLSCDNASTAADKRLCWHTSGGALSTGWRCGATVSLYTSSWERVVYHAD